MNQVYVQINSQGKVFAISQIGCDLVKVDTNDSRLLGTTYDPETRTFSGIHIILATDKTNIIANGEDVATLTATAINWDDTPSDYDGEIEFVIGTSKVNVPMENGVATYEFTADSPGEYVIQTNAEVMSNGKEKITAVEPQE